MSALDQRRAPPGGPPRPPPPPPPAGGGGAAAGARRGEGRPPRRAGPPVLPPGAPPPPPARTRVACAFASPAQLEWREGAAALLRRGEAPLPLARIARFFPAEWLPELPRRAGWRHFFAGGRTPLSNPATALLSQSKRFPLAWPEL